MKLLTITAIASLLALASAAPPVRAQAAAAAAAKGSAALTQAVQQARQLRLQGNPAESAKVLGAVVEAHPNDFRAQYNLGLAFHGTGDTPAAIGALQKAKTINEKDKIGDATIYNSLGWVYLQSGDYTQALKEFKTAEKPQNFSALTPESQRKVLNNIGVTYAYVGEAKLANDYFAKAKTVPAASTAAAK
jgi:Flp pilus assembly protein TadD